MKITGSYRTPQITSRDIVLKPYGLAQHLRDDVI
jgi:hypothetical protein